MKNEKRGIKTGNIFWGLFLVLAAVFLVVSQLGLLKDIGVFSILFAVFWVAILIEGLIRGSFGKILFSLAFLFIIFDEPLGIEAVNSWTVLAAALLAIALSCVLFAMGVSSGISIILCTVAASAVMALLHPVEEGGEQA